MKTTVSALTLAIALTLSGAANAQQGYVWAFDRYDANSVFDITLSLVYGVPQTDDLQLSARCVVGGVNPVAEVILSAPIGVLPHGSGARLHLSEGSYVQVINANVVVLEELLEGVEFVLATDNPLFDALAAGSEIIYAIEGQAARTLSLRGSARAVRPFTQQCAALRI